MRKIPVGLSVVVPVYNEYNNLLDLTERILKIVAVEVKSCEIIFIDDGSTDGSSQLLDELARNYRQVRVFHLKERQGQTAALAAGFEQVQGDLIATVDADLQVDPADLLKFLPYIGDYDLIIGIRRDRQDGIFKRIFSRIGNGVRNFLTSEEITDSGCPLKLFTRGAAGSLIPYDGMHRFLPTLASMNGFRVTEVPIKHFPRKHGKSKYGFNKGIMRGLFDTLVIRWMQQRKINLELLTEEHKSGENIHPVQQTGGTEKAHTWQKEII